MLAFPRTLAVVFVCALVPSCDKDGGGGGGRGGGPVASEEASVAGTGTVAIQVEPKEGAPAESAALATVTVLGHPEIAAATDAQGNAVVNNVPPGTVALIVTSADGTALTAGAASYGLKIDDVVVKPSEKNDLGKQKLKQTGSISGSVKFYSNPNDLDLIGSEVFVPGTSFIAKTDETGAFALAGIPEGTYNLRAQHTGFAVLDLAEVTVVEAADTDLGDLLLSLSTGPEGGIAIEADATVEIADQSRSVMTASDRHVTVKLDYDGDTALMKISDEPSFLNKAWLPVAHEAEWTEFDADGEKAIYVMYSDLNGLESSPYKVEFIVDSEAPSGGTIAIQNDWDQLASGADSMRATVAAADGGTGVAKMMICTTNNFETCGSWVDYSTEAAGIAVAANAYVKFKDYVGHVSTVASDTINLGSHTIVAGGEYAGDLHLYEAQSPFRFDSHITVAGNMTIDAGVTLDHGGTSSTITVLGRLTADGAGAAISITQSTGAFGGFDLSTSSADDNLLRNIIVGSGVLMTNPFLKINGGTVADCDITGDTSVTFIVKSGYKSALIEGNVVTEAKVVVSGGNATTIRGNAFDGVLYPAISVSGGSDTVITYNSFNTTGSSAGTEVDAIQISSGDATVSYNDIVFGSTSMMSETARGIELTGGGTVTVTHNNFAITSDSDGTKVEHLNAAAGSTIVADYNHYEGHATTNPNNIGAGITSTNHSSAWPTTPAADCVGSGCL